MADPAPHVTPIRADIGKPTAAHQQLWNQIDDRIHQHMSDYLPRMGTVLSNDDGHVTVTMDEEADDRTIPLPRHKGTRHLPGDRVIVQRLQGGDEVISHGISSKQGKDPAVDSNQIFAGAIKQEHLSSASTGGAAVGPAELQGQAVQRVHLAPEVSGDISDARTQGITGQTLANTAQGAANTAQTTANTAKDNAKTANDAIGHNGGTSGNSTGLWSSVHAADEHAQDVYNQLQPSASNGNTAYNDIHTGGNSILKRLAALEAYNTAHP
jgi:hypothetical protein